MVYERFPRLAERKTQIAGTLSGGEQQMLAFIKPPVALSNGGVAIRMLSMMMLPSAGWLAIEKARKVGSGLVVTRSHI